MSTVPVKKAWSTRRIAIMALFTATSIAVTYIKFPLIPATSYLTYDPSGIFCVFVGLVEGPLAALVVGILTWIPRAASNPFGCFMAMLSTVSFAVPIAYIYQRNNTRGGLLLGSLIGGCISIVACILGSLIVTPIYLKISIDAVMKMIVPITLPFNVIKVVMHSAACQLCYTNIMHIVHCTLYVDDYDHEAGIPHSTPFARLAHL